METITLSHRLKYDPVSRQIVTDYKAPIAHDTDINKALPLAEKICKAQTLIEQAMDALNDCPESLPLISTIINTHIPPDIAERITRSTERRKKAKEKTAKRLESRQTAQDTDAITPAGRVINVIHNEAKSGIEIQYDGKPSAEAITTLKDKGFRYSIRQKLWYCPYSHDTWSWAESLPQHDQQPVPQPTPIPTPPAPTSALPTIDIAALLGRKTTLPA